MDQFKGLNKSVLIIGIEPNSCEPLRFTVITAGLPIQLEDSHAMVIQPGGPPRRVKVVGIEMQGFETAYDVRDVGPSTSAT